MREASTSLRRAGKALWKWWWWGCCGEEKGQKRHAGWWWWWWWGSPAKTAVNLPNQKLRSFVRTTEKQSRLEGKEDQGDQVAQKRGVEARESLSKKQQL